MMFTELTLEEVDYEPKKIFKTCSSFHLVTGCDGGKATCSCPGYYQHMVCEHATLMDMLYDRHFQVPEKFAEECAEFRKRVGRRKGVQQAENEMKVKKSEWDVIICGVGMSWMRMNPCQKGSSIELCMGGVREFLVVTLDRFPRLQRFPRLHGGWLAAQIRN